MNLTEKTFYGVTAGPGTKVVQFTADWCGPCKMLAPQLAKLSGEYGFDYYKVDVDQNSELARNFKIMSIPTVLVYVDGVLKNSFTGIRPAAELKTEIGLTG